MWQAQPQEQQDDLFPDGQSAARRRRSRGAPLFPLTRWTISVSYEQIVLSTVALILAGVVLFALGMERGKRFTGQPLSAPVERAALAFAEHAAAPLPPRTAPTPAPAAVAAATPAVKAPSAAKPRFTIQVATFAQPALAEEQMRLLRQRGYQAFLITSGKFSALCVGTYATPQDAARHLAAVKSSYRDSFVRQR